MDGTEKTDTSTEQDGAIPFRQNMSDSQAQFDESIEKGVVYLQRAGLEMIAAARVFLDAAEHVLEDDQKVSDVVSVLSGLADLASKSVERATDTTVHSVQKTSRKFYPKEGSHESAKNNVDDHDVENETENVDATDHKMNQQVDGKESTIQRIKLG